MGSNTEKQSFFTYRTPFGQVTIQSDGTAITGLVLKRQQMEGSETATEITNDCATQVNEYLAGKRNTFDIPIRPAGSDFQKEVWEAVSNIPFGQTRTPSEVATSIGSPNSVRAVGRAIRENPIAMIIPAHRVLPSNGRVDSTDTGAVLRQKFRELESRFA